MKALTRRGSQGLLVAALLAAFVATVGSCWKGNAKTPDPAPPRTLAPESEGAAAVAMKPFAVVFGRPTGPVVDPSEISIVWNRPMRALELAGEESAAPATVTLRDGGEVKGAWRWMGTSAVIFAPATALPRASEYVVTVPRGTKALDGSTLADDYTFSFSTPPPKLVTIQASDNEQHLTPASTFDLRFNQPVELKEVERATQMLIGTEATPWPFRVSMPKPAIKTLVRLTPTTRLPLASDIQVVVAGSLHGMEGPLTLGQPRSTVLATYGPLVAQNLECSRDTPNKKCDASNPWLRVELSNNVRCKDWQAHVRISPTVPMHWSCDDSPANNQYIPATLAPAKSYVVTITPGLKDEFGQTLARAVTFPFETDDAWPSVAVGLEGSVFEAGKPGDTVAEHTPGARIIPIASVNTPSYDLSTAAPDEANVARYLTMTRNDFDEMATLLKATVTEVTGKAPRNRTEVNPVSLDTLIGAGKRGAAFVGVRSREHHPWRGDTDLRLVSVTDLAISAKMSRFGSVVWVSRLSDGQPVPKAIVAIRDKTGQEVFKTEADGDGIAVIPSDKYNPVTVGSGIDDDAVIFARDAGDWTYKRVSDRINEWRLGVPTDISGQLAPIGMLFTERGVYRPGETVRVKGIFRQPHAKATVTPAGRDVHVDALDGSGEKFFDQTVKLDAFGGFAVDVAVPSTARLGTGELNARVESDTGDSSTGTASASIMLAEYKAAEFKVEVEPSKPSFIRGDAATFTTRGDYLFGAPMSGGSVRFTVTRGPGSFVPPGAEEMILGDGAYASDLPSESLRGGEMQSGNGALTDKGTFAQKTPLAMPAQRGTELVTFEAEVADVSRQTISGRSAAIVHPGEFYVAMKPPTDMFVHKGDTVKPELAAFEPSGTKREGVAIHVDLVRRSWRSVLEATSGSGRHYESVPVDKVMASCDVTTSAAPASCDLAVSDAGYLIVHATAKDGRKNPLASSFSLYSLGDSADLGWRMSDSATLDLVPDKREYEIGDTATVLIKSPFPEASALVTVERAGVYRQERQTLTGPTPTLSIPITDEMRPNAFVSVELVRGRSKAAPPSPEKGHDIPPDPGVPVYRLGYTTLSINPAARRLKVDIIPAKKALGPGDTVEADVHVVDREGHGIVSSVTFYAVDEGVLMLTGYRTPDPIPTFTAPRPLAVFGLESRESLARLLINPNGGVGGDKGGDGGGGGGNSSVRADFRATAYFEPSLTTSSEGKAHVQFKLPDGLTTYRLMAVVAAKDDRFGFGESQVVTSRPLMARPAMPRFLRAGDTVDAGIVVMSKGMPAGQVEVALSATGVSVSGDVKRVVALPANGSTEVRWPIAAPVSGKAEFTFSVRALGGDPKGAALPHDEVRVTRNVEIPLSPEAVALYGETTGVATERLGDMSSMRDDTGGLDIRLASTALIGLGDGVEALIKYPYGCTEQLTSRLVPLIPLVSLAKDYHVDLPANLDPVIDETIAKILKNQQSDGSFGWWVDSRQGDDWLTAYALWGLSVAKTSGRAVPADALDRATRSLRGSLAKWDTNPYTRANAAFALDVLAMVGSPDTGYMDRVYEVREKLPLFARALLAHAMVVSHAAPQEVAELLRDAEGHLRVTPTGATVVENIGSEYSTLMDSEAWTTAIVLRALVASDPAHPLAARIAKGLLGMRKGGTWRSTEETAWALLALDDYRHAQEKEEPNFDAKVTLNGAPLFEAPFLERDTHTASTSFTAAKLFETHAPGAALGFSVAGKGKLFYEARLRYAKKELPKEGLDRGFSVRKLVRSLRPEQLRTALATLPASSMVTANASNLVLVDLLIVTPDPREQVVIDDPLPAGLEPVDTALATTARSLDVGDPNASSDPNDPNDNDGDARANGLAYNDVWYHREFRDDRVLTFIEHMAAGMYHFRYLARATTMGTFVVPPTRAECMYEPETFGRTGGTSFEVKAP